MGRWARKPVNHTSWVAVVTPTDRPKSVRNRCVIELFCDVVNVYVILPFWQFCWCRGFCHRTESDLFLFLFVSVTCRKNNLEVVVDRFLELEWNYQKLKLRTLLLPFIWTMPFSFLVCHSNQVKFPLLSQPWPPERFEHFFSIFTLSAHAVHATCMHIAGKHTYYIWQSSRRQWVRTV